MIQGQGLPFGECVDIYVGAEPWNWDTDGSTGATDDDPIERLRTAADNNGYLTEFDAVEINGLDH